MIQGLALKYINHENDCYMYAMAESVLVPFMYVILKVLFVFCHTV